MNDNNNNNNNNNNYKINKLVFFNKKYFTII